MRVALALKSVGEVAEVSLFMNHFDRHDVGRMT